MLQSKIELKCGPGLLRQFSNIICTSCRTDPALVLKEAALSGGLACPKCSTGALVEQKKHYVCCQCKATVNEKDLQKTLQVYIYIRTNNVQEVELALMNADAHGNGTRTVERGFWDLRNH